MDLLERNYTVHVLADGVSSRTMVERMYALEVTHPREYSLVLSYCLHCLTALSFKGQYRQSAGGTCQPRQKFSHFEKSSTQSEIKLKIHVLVKYI